MELIEQCYQLMRMRHFYERRPRYFYMSGDTYTALHFECAKLTQHVAPLGTFSGHLLLYGLEVVPFDLPDGYILASETRLH